VSFVVDKVVLGQVFSEYFDFPLPIRIPTIAPQLSIIWGWYNRPISGRHTKWTQSHPTPREKKNLQTTKFFLAPSRKI
jgi:hypothetical protein